MTVKGDIVGKESNMLSIPSAAEAIFMSFSVAFTQPTFQRILLLASGTLMTFGQRTIRISQNYRPGCETCYPDRSGQYSFGRLQGNRRFAAHLLPLASEVRRYEP